MKEHAGMQLARVRIDSEQTPRAAVVEGQGLRLLPRGVRLADVLNAPDPRLAVEQAGVESRVLEAGTYRLLAPVDDQEVWGAGVTYERSKVARQEESETGGSFYDQVYRANRPELFFKATPSRVAGPDQPIRVRRDTSWCVPEPELTLVLTPDLRLVGYTIGNDVSARDIEGRNPLYLPQAKVYDASCGLGPVVTLTDALPDPGALEIHLLIERGGSVAFEGKTSTARMARTFEDLIGWLGRDNLFPCGVFLLTGTGIVPPDEFSLRPGDLVHIRIDGIGTLRNPVVQGPPLA
jgi:2-dehydro-3-deoxy-D-arabinonate dehydratase